MNAVLEMSTSFEGLFNQAAANMQPSWLKAFREQQFDRWLKRGLPSRKDEWWKYTNVAYLENEKFDFPVLAGETAIPEKTMDSPILMVFKNGRFLQEMSKIDLLPSGVILSSFNEAVRDHEDLVKPYLLQEFDGNKHPFAYLNSALMNDGMFLYVPKNCQVPYPIHLLFLSSEQNNFISCYRNIVVAKENSQVKIIEEHTTYKASRYFTNNVTELYVSDNACLDYYKLQNEDSTATHIANIKIQQKQNSSVNTFFADYGSRLAREDLTVHFHEQNAQCHMNGLYLLNQDEQHVDNHIFVDHAAMNCTSSMVYKGILDKKSQAVFNGKVFAHSGAKQTNALQSNHNLLLSSLSEVNTKPELEIYTDDVKCTHGATIGQLDEDAMFYLRARGIEKEAALKILSQAFVEEVMEKIVDPDIKNYIQRQVMQHASV